jgi:mRNA interferase MazF
MKLNDGLRCRLTSTIAVDDRHGPGRLFGERAGRPDHERSAWNFPTELPVGTVNGLDHESVVSRDDVMTIDAGRLGRLVGYLRPEQETLLCRAMIGAFDLCA